VDRLARASFDLPAVELIEINLPAGYGTWALRAAPGAAGVRE